MSFENDVLVELNKEDISKLKETYREVEDACYVYTLLDIAERWYGERGLTITSPGDAWKQDGSFVAFVAFGLPTLFPYSLDKNCEKICEALLTTKRIDPDKPIYFVNIADTHVDAILTVIQKLGRQVNVNNENFLYTMSIEKAKSLQIECPPEVQIRRLDPQHAEQMDRVWPHRLENSLEYVRDWVTKNVGYGLFLKDSDELVSWIVQSVVGHMNLLQTEEKYKGRGYGKLMVLQLAKHLAETGHVPVATVLKRNAASNRLFTKLGFETKINSYFLNAGKK